MTREQVENFEKLAGQLQSAYDELSVMSKKSPDGGVNKFKLGFVNKLLRAANDLLEDHYKPFDEFAEFDIDNVPTNSDVILVLAQYGQCLEKLRADNVRLRSGLWYWITEDGQSNGQPGEYKRTTKPKQLREE